MVKKQEPPGLENKYSTDVLYHYRDKIFYRFSQIGLLLISPFVINNFYQGRIDIGIWSSIVLLVFLLDAVAIHLKKQPPVPPALISIPILIGICLSIKNLGFIAGVWFYPAIILYFFILPRFWANLVSLVSAAIITLTAYYFGYQIDLISRVLVATLLTIIFINILFDVINKLHSKLEKAATVDELTGAYNRRHMNTIMETAISYKKRYQTRYSVLSLDLDNFKSINDGYGHSTGDIVLQKFVNFIKGSLRDVDYLFRTGGEEFIIILPETDLNQATMVAEKIRGMIEKDLNLYNKIITVSIGVGELQDEETIDNLLKRCDRALYDAKDQGRNRVCTAV